MTSDDLETLAAFLTSDATPPTAMPADMLHGFLTALVTGPATLPLSVWFPYVWSKDGRERPRFENPMQGTRIVSLIFNLLNDIKSVLDDPHVRFQPLVSISYDGDEAYKDGRLWAVGFMEAVGLHREEWASFLASEIGRDILEPILLLQGKRSAADGDAPLGTAAQVEDWTLAISDAVAKTALYFFEERQHWGGIDAMAGAAEIDATGDAPDPPATATTSVPITSVAEHCPCGSGRPFKACCGHPSRLH